MHFALALAGFASLFFGIALVTARLGLRSLDARSGAAVSIPTAALLIALAAPFMLDLRGFDLGAAAWFAVVGLFFPAVVTLLTFRANETLGPTVTATVSGTAPLFALLAAGTVLGEHVPPVAALASVGILIGVILVSWRRGAARVGASGWALGWPIAGAVLRGVAQAGAKAGLLLWPNPFAAALVGYLVSAATVIGVNRLGRARRPAPFGRGHAWFALTGVLNGAAVLLMYAALRMAPVSLVAPVIATYPLVTAVIGALVLRDEALSIRVLAGVAITVLAVVTLVRVAGGG